VSARWTVKARRMGTVHIVRWWEVLCDGVVIDTYEDREMAHAYVKYMNGRSGVTRAPLG
jgi:hypothetical protein